MLCCPSLSPYQWFPFTITSAPQEETITIHVHVSVWIMSFELLLFALEAL